MDQGSSWAEMTAGMVGAQVCSEAGLETAYGLGHNGARLAMKALKHIPRVSDDQISFGTKLGLDLRGCTLSVAAARIEDAIDIGFHGASSVGNPRPKQIALAAKFGYEIAGLSRREGDAVIDDLMTELNHETIEGEELAPGVAVVNCPKVQNHAESGERSVLFSSRVGGMWSN